MILEQISDRDADALRQMVQNDLVYRYLPTFLFERKYSDPHEVIRNLYGDIFLSKESLILGVYLPANRQFCGLAEFYGFKDSLHKTCIGYRLSDRFWGRGIATETVSLMVDYLYTKTDTEIITASTMIENHASSRVLQKNGFLMTASSVPEDWGYPNPTIADKWFR
ncbi:MAG: GNAT family N-acetyltransferase [Oscillospiraceae bacterium]|nr:GNAT family N-acetyltransferase [Oscillospiraceae bacterium]